MDDLTLPGSIPGLLRRGSPVVLDTDEGQRRGVVVDADRAFGGHVVVMFEATPRHDAQSDYLPAARLALDLTDATGRAHADWFWRRHRCADLGPDHWSVHSPTLGGGYGCGGFQGFPEYAAILADLDPADPRLLPDGSRWVDAEALRRVCLHVALEAAKEGA